MLNYNYLNTFNKDTFIVDLLNDTSIKEKADKSIKVFNPYIETLQFINNDIHNDTPTCKREIVNEGINGLFSLSSKSEWGKYLNENSNTILSIKTLLKDEKPQSKSLCVNNRKSMLERKLKSAMIKTCVHTGFNRFNSKSTKHFTAVNTAFFTKNELKYYKCNIVEEL